MTRKYGVPGLDLRAPVPDRRRDILSTAALTLLADIERRFRSTRSDLLAQRVARQADFDHGVLPQFLPETKGVREAKWEIAPPAPGLTERKVEITGPTERKMTINALNSGASVWLADFEDANVPLWTNILDGQANIVDAVRRTITFQSDDGKEYQLGDKVPTIVVRPRGWHLVDQHITVDGQPVSASLLDFVLYLVNCGKEQLNVGLGPYYYLPKLESHLEARLWSNVFAHAEDALSLKRGTIRATVLIETITAAFEMDEILFELKEHAAGLNAGRWDYLFSIIKKLRNSGPDFILPDRSSLTMTVPPMQTYTQLLVDTCHKRGAHAIGGMAAYVPNRRDPMINGRAITKVREDKEREAEQGFDGSWVAHPDLVSICKGAFDSVMGGKPNQLDRLANPVNVEPKELLAFHATEPACTEAGLRNNVSVALQYLAAWLGGSGAVAIYNLMEDVATAEIARSQVWQWLHHGVVLESGEVVTEALVERVISEELNNIRTLLGDKYDTNRFAAAHSLFRDIAVKKHFHDFLTIPALELLGDSP